MRLMNSCLISVKLRDRQGRAKVETLNDCYKSKQIKAKTNNGKKK